MKVNITQEMLERHSDEEVIEYLDSVLSGLVRNYKVSLEKGNSDVLWANLGDLTLASTVVKAMRKRNEARKASTEK